MSKRSGPVTSNSGLMARRLGMTTRQFRRLYGSVDRFKRMQPHARRLLYGEFKRHCLKVKA